MLFHFTMFEESSQPLYRAALRMASLGWASVDLFFVLSGFLLFGPWVKASAASRESSTATDGASPSVRRYAWHRVRRIMPAYVVTVLVAYALSVKSVRP